MLISTFVFSFFSSLTSLFQLATFELSCFSEKHSCSFFAPSLFSRWSYISFEHSSFSHSSNKVEIETNKQLFSIYLLFSSSLSFSLHSFLCLSSFSFSTMLSLLMMAQGTPSEVSSSTYAFNNFFNFILWKLIYSCEFFNNWFSMDSIFETPWIGMESSRFSLDFSFACSYSSLSRFLTPNLNLNASFNILQVLMV